MDIADNTQAYRWVPWAIVGGFALLTMALGGMTALAIHGFPGVWTERAYEKGLNYNHALKAAEEQKALGWRGELNAEVKDVRNLEIAFRLKDAKGKPIEGARTRLLLTRPSDAALDLRASLEALDHGLYATTLALPVSGVWDMKVSATHGGKNYQTSKRIVVP